MGIRNNSSIRIVLNRKRTELEIPSLIKERQPLTIQEIITRNIKKIKEFTYISGIRSYRMSKELSVEVIKNTIIESNLFPKEEIGNGIMVKILSQETNVNNEITFQTYIKRKEQETSVTGKFIYNTFWDNSGSRKACKGTIKDLKMQQIKKRVVSKDPRKELAKDDIIRMNNLEKQIKKSVGVDITPNYIKSWLRPEDVGFTLCSYLTYNVFSDPNTESRTNYGTPIVKKKSELYNYYNIKGDATVEFEVWRVHKKKETLHKAVIELLSDQNGNVKQYILKEFSKI